MSCPGKNRFEGHHFDGTLKGQCIHQAEWLLLFHQKNGSVYDVLSREENRFERYHFGGTLKGQCIRQAEWLLLFHRKNGSGAAMIHYCFGGDLKKNDSTNEDQRTS
jgi:hypothetical protein